MAYRMLPTNGSALPESGGVVNSALQYVTSASAGNRQTGLVATAAPGTIFYNVTVTADVVNMVQYTGLGNRDGVVPVQLDADDYIGDPYYGEEPDACA